MNSAAICCHISYAVAKFTSTGAIGITCLLSSFAILAWFVVSSCQRCVPSSLCGVV